MICDTRAELLELHENEVIKAKIEFLKEFLPKYEPESEEKYIFLDDTKTKIYYEWQQLLKKLK